MPVPSSLKSKLSAAEEVVKECQKNPSLLNEPELLFMKKFVDGEPVEIDDDDDVPPELEEVDESGNAAPASAPTSEAAVPNEEEGTIPPEKQPFPMIPKNADETPEDADWSIAGEKKSQASAAASEGNYDDALKFYGEALEAEAVTASLSATTLAKRADILLKLDRPAAAVHDCDAALIINPDSVRALKTRGKANRRLGYWTKANLDLAAAQNIDYDPDLAELCSLVKDKAASELAKERDAERKKELEERKKKAAEEHRKKMQQEEAERAASSGPGMGGGMPGMGGGMPGMGGGMPGMGGGMPGMGGGMPGMGGGMPGMGGGMPGMGGGIPGMDPDLMASLQNPKVIVFNFISLITI